MDGVSAAATILQLLDSIQKLVKFCRAVQKAPSEIKCLSEELQQLSFVLSSIKSPDEFIGAGTLEFQILQTCWTKVQTLQERISKKAITLNSRNIRLRTWSLFNTVFTLPELKALRDDIERTKTCLLVFMIGTSSVTTESHLKRQDERLEAISRAVYGCSEDTRLLLQRHSKMQIYNYTQEIQIQSGFPETAVLLPPKPEYSSSQNAHHQVEGYILDCVEAQQTRRCRTSARQDAISSIERNIPTPLFNIHKRASSKKVTIQSSLGDQKTSIEEEVNYVVAPNYLMKKLGFSSGISFNAKSTTFWKYTLQTFNACSDNHLIFEFCRDGNLKAVQKMLSCGQASLRDRDSMGRTPLWIATRSLQPEVADFLLQQGADPYAFDWRRNWPPISAFRENNELEATKKLSMISLFQKYGCEDLEEAEILYLMGGIMLSYRPTKPNGLSEPQARQAALLLCQQLAKFISINDNNMSQILLGFLQFNYTKSVLRWSISKICRNILDESTGLPNNTAIHQALSRKLLYRDPISVELIAQKTENLHQTANIGIKNAPSTPTSLAMHQPEIFYRWIRVLRSTGHDLEHFVAEELATSSPLVDEGWTHDTLSILFHSAPMSNSLSSKSGFYNCERCLHLEYGSCTKVDLPWRSHLRDIRTGRGRTSNFDSNSNDVKFNISYGFEESDCYDGGVFAPFGSKQELTRRPVPLMVCSGECEDGVCVADLYENDLDDKPVIPPFRLVVEELEVDEELCPAIKMPGAFVS